MKARLFALTLAFAAVAFAASASNMPAWKTPTYTLVARGLDLRVALDTFAVAEGLSVVMSDAVQGVFSGDFRDVPCSEFLERIATVHNLTWYYDGAALYIYGAGEIRTFLLDLQYMKAGEVRAMLAELGVEDERFPLRTTSNDELIMVSGPPRYVALVAEMISKADKLREVRTFNEVDVRLFPLRNTWADDVSFRSSGIEDSQTTIRGVASLLNDMMNGDGAQKSVWSARKTEGADKGAAAENADAATQGAPAPAFRPVIKPDNRLNAVFVKDVKSRLPIYERLIKELDVPQKLVEIAVTVVELSKEDALDWQLSLSGNTSHGHSKGAIGQSAGSLFGQDALFGKGLAGAMTHIHSSYALAASLTALREKGKARNISRTSLLTVNNMSAEMTDTQSYHARVVGTEVATLAEVSAGTRLIAKPRIMSETTTNAPGRIWLTLELQDGGFETISVDSMPMTRSSTLETQTSVDEGTSIMLAGYFRDIVEEAGWGIPYLRDIPYIGWLFGGSSSRTETVQRMFILTPYIIGPGDVDVVGVQSGRLRDTSREEDLEDDAEYQDLERKHREYENKERRQRRRERAELDFERRTAELKHERGLRKIDNKRAYRLLSEDIKRWKEDLKEAEKQAEEEAEDAASAEDAEEVEPFTVDKAAEPAVKADEAEPAGDVEEVEPFAETKPVEAGGALAVPAQEEKPFYGLRALRDSMGATGQ